MLSILFDQNHHLHARGGDVAELDGNAEALEDHCDSVLRVLDLTRGVVSNRLCVVCTFHNFHIIMRSTVSICSFLWGKKKNILFNFPSRCLHKKRMTFWKGISQIHKWPEPVKIYFSGRTIHVTAVNMEAKKLEIECV